MGKSDDCMCRGTLQRKQSNASLERRSVSLRKCLISSEIMSGPEKIGTRRIVPRTGGEAETRRLAATQDGKCVEGGCPNTPTFKLEEKMAHGWITTDFLCAEHADVCCSRYGLGRL
jgi:hypothetical protein